jgi:hypothetical protein
MEVELRQAVRAEMASLGRRYDRIDLESMEIEALRDLLRLIRDLKYEATCERQKRRRGQFWG